MRSIRGRVFILLALGLVASFLMLLRPETASAHPLGNFTVNTLSIVELSPEQTGVRFIVDMAEIPAFQEKARIDRNGDEAISDDERAAYLESMAKEIGRGLQLLIDGASLELSPFQQGLDFPPGQGGLSTMRLVVSFRAENPPLSSGQHHEMKLRNANYAERTGYKNIVIRGVGGVTLIDTTASDSDRTDELRAYPQDFISSPPSLLEGRSTFAVSATGRTAGASATPETSGSARRSDDVLTSLITTRNMTLPVIILSFAIALGLGALHAASPGHGKTIMAAYLVGTRGTASHALFLGISVTMSHTLGVAGLGLIVLFASDLIVPERLYPWLSLISGVMIAGIGSWLLVTRLRSSPHHHIPDDSVLTAPHKLSVSARLSRFGADVLHGHSHDNPNHHYHWHEPPAETRGLRPTWKSLAALGLVGGLVPSASALIILLAAISLQRIGFGLALILAFSAGMAAVLVGVGLLLVYARRSMERFQGRSKPIAVLNRLLPYATALIVMLSGLTIAARAVFQVGLL